MFDFLSHWICSELCFVIRQKLKACITAADGPGSPELRQSRNKRSCTQRKLTHWLEMKHSKTAAVPKRRRTEHESSGIYEQEGESSEIPFIPLRISVISNVAAKLFFGPEFVSSMFKKLNFWRWIWISKRLYDDVLLYLTSCCSYQAVFFNSAPHLGFQMSSYSYEECDYSLNTLQI